MSAANLVWISKFCVQFINEKVYKVNNSIMTYITRNKKVVGEIAM